MNQYVAPQQPSASPAAVPAGWYPDPHSQTPGAERWWDGVSWSQEFAREPQQVPAVPAGFQAPGAAPPRGKSIGAAAAMVLGALLLVGRVYFMTHHSNAGQTSSYQSGAVVGNIVATVLSAWLFSWGLTHRDPDDQFRDDQMWPIAIGASLVTLALGFVL